MKILNCTLRFSHNIQKGIFVILRISVTVILLLTLEDRNALSPTKIQSQLNMCRVTAHPMISMFVSVKFEVVFPVISMNPLVFLHFHVFF